MKVLKENKGLIGFYVCIILFAVVWASNVNNNNDRLMVEKNSYILSDNI